MARLGFACRCGTIRGEVADVAPSDMTRIVCHCRDCRSHFTHLGLADPEKVEILQTAQDNIRILQGGEKLRVFRLGPNGALRWYATCCDTPLFYTPLKPRAVHVGLNAAQLDDADRAGPVMAEAHLPGKQGLARHKGAGRMVARMARRVAAHNLSGKWRDTPFFDAEGRPVADPTILSREERAAALMQVRP